MTPSVETRPDQRYAWHGPSLLVVNGRGECDGTSPLSGYYYREARYLSTLRLSINGESPWVCERTESEPRRLLFTYIYPELAVFGGGGSGWSGDDAGRNADGIGFRTLDLALSYDVRINDVLIALTITNRSRVRADLHIAWQLAADFADLIEAKAERARRTLVVVEHDERVIEFRAQDERLPYRTRVTASGSGEWGAHADRVASRLELAPSETAELMLRVEPIDFSAPMPNADALDREHAWTRWRNGLAVIDAPRAAIVERIHQSSCDDLASFALLEGQRDEWLTLQAGIPLYPALFGRDTLTAGWQFAWMDSGASLDASLTRLGRMQGSTDVPARDEQPGRIIQQARTGPLSRLGDVPFGRYYGDFASPLMFVVSLAQLFAWTADRSALERHWDAARRVLDWARTYGDRDGDGYLEYETLSPLGPKHQGWKDSGDAIVNDDGTPVPAPIGTCELQGYWFAAQELMAVMSWVMGAHDDAKAHWRSAQELKTRFNRDWWLEDDGFFALAMDREKRRVRAISSNVGHCIASGLVSDEHLPRVVARLFEPDSFSGWGVRTLATTHASYNPLSYHLGSVWAVENATLAFGLRRYGFDAESLDLARSLFDLAELYPNYRIPEAVGGYSRTARPSPGAYPRSNSPQLWNASAFPLLVQTMCGLQPVAPLDMLVIDPVLPHWLPEITIRRFRLGAATATLRFWRDDDGRSHGEVIESTGTLHLVHQQPPESLSAGIGDRFRALVDGILHH